jgi:hypothetical protein
MLVKDRVKESATGTSGNLSLQGADTGYVAFSTIGNNEYTYYCVISADRTQWEVGYGQLNSDSSELIRPATVISNSAGNTSRLTLGSGTHTVFCTSPASKSVYLDNSGAANVAVSVFTNDAGYLTSYTETNDLSSAVTWANVPDANITESSVTQHQAALSITESQISDFGTYLTSETSHADVVVDGDFGSEGLMKRGGSAGTYTIVTDNSSNWNTAFGWGNHASAGYLTSISGITTSSFDAATLVTEADDISDNDNDTTIPTSAAVKDYADHAESILKCVNASGGTLNAGEAVYLSGHTGTQIQVDKADNTDAAKMPAIGIVKTSASNNAAVDIVTHGKLIGIDTSTPAYSVGDELYINGSGALTDVVPTGESSLIQKMAKVVRVHASSGEIYIMGAGRSNAVPNLNSAKIFLGNASNKAVATSITGDVTITNAGVTTVGSVGESIVTAHQAALSITESQISDLGSYITASSIDTLTNKSGNISQWTNDSGYLTAVSGLTVSNFDAATIVLESEGIGSNDNDTTIPTSAAVVDYVANNAGGASDLNDLGDVSYGGTNLSHTILINNNPGSAPNHGTLGSDNTRNLGIGYFALSSITDASYNIALGSLSGWQLTTGDKNVFIGQDAGSQITDGDSNICIGYQTQYYGNDGDYNIAIGIHALRGNSNGTSTTNNYNNIGIGQQALYKIEDGDSNVAVGYKAANEVKNGQQNVAVGYQAQLYDETCDHNVAIGRDALKGSASSDNQQYNTGVGATALFAITTGSYNTGAGAYTGADLTTGDKNVYLGYSAGTGATATESNMLYIGNAIVSLDGTIIKADMAEKHIAFGMADDHFSNTTGSATVQIYPKDAADNALEIKMTATPSAATRALEVKNSSGTSQYSVTADGAVKSKMHTETYGATTTFDLNESNFFTVTLTGDSTFALSNSTTGQRFVIRVVQDGTGSHGVTWWSGLKWANATAPTLTTAANSIDTFGFICTDSSTPVYEGYIIGQNVATPS